MSDNRPLTGGCLCGAVRFELDRPTRFCAHCHCSWCRRAHGAPYVTWTGVLSSQFRITAGDDQRVRFESSPGAFRSFCRRCGSTMLFEAERWAGEVHVAVACLDDGPDQEPKAHVYYSHRAPWLDLDRALPRLGGDSGVDPIDE
jgi:hypothetical protein